MSDDTGAIVGAVIAIAALVLAIGLLVSGLFSFGTADYLRDPVHAFENQVSGLIQIGIGSTILLVLIGGTAAVAALLGFIGKVADKTL